MESTTTLSAEGKLLLKKFDLTAALDLLAWNKLSEKHQKFLLKLDELGMLNGELKAIIQDPTGTEIKRGETVDAMMQDKKYEFVITALRSPGHTENPTSSEKTTPASQEPVVTEKSNQGENASNEVKKETVGSSSNIQKKREVRKRTSDNSSKSKDQKKTGKTTVKNPDVTNLPSDSFVMRRMILKAAASIFFGIACERKMSYADLIEGIKKFHAEKIVALEEKVSPFMDGIETEKRKSRIQKGIERALVNLLFAPVSNKLSGSSYSDALEIIVGALYQKDFVKVTVTVADTEVATQLNAEKEKIMRKVAEQIAEEMFSTPEEIIDRILPEFDPVMKELNDQILNTFE